MHFDQVAPPHQQGGEKTKIGSDGITGKGHSPIATSIQGGPLWQRKGEPPQEAALRRPAKMRGTPFSSLPTPSASSSAVLGEAVASKASINPLGTKSPRDSRNRNSSATNGASWSSPLAIAPNTAAEGGGACWTKGGHAPRW